MIKVALVSDVHGNLTAYQAVLDDLERRGVDLIFNLGDVIGKGPRGAECIELTRQRCAVTVRGNWDEFIGSDDHQVAASGSWWRDQLEPDHRSWLAGLPFSHDFVLSGRTVRIFHASATSPFTRVHVRHTDEEFAQMFANTPATGGGAEPVVVGYGDIHAAYVKVNDGLTLFNAGSVGNPLDETAAAYVILEGDLGGEAAAPFGFQLVRVPYDIEREVAEAAALGNPEQDAYALELRTAMYRGRARRLGLLG